MLANDPGVAREHFGIAFAFTCTHSRTRVKAHQASKKDGTTTWVAKKGWRHQIFGRTGREGSSERKLHHKLGQIATNPDHQSLGRLFRVDPSPRH